MFDTAQLANYIIAAAMMSIGAAIACLLARRPAQNRWTGAIFVIYLFAAGLGHIERTCSEALLQSPATALDIVAGAAGLVTAVFVWLLVIKKKGFPTYDELEKKNKDMVELTNRLSRAQKLFVVFMDNSPALASIKDAEGRMLYANRAFQELARPVGEGPLPDLAEFVSQNMRLYDNKVLEQNEPMEFIELVQLADGRKQDWLVVKFPIELPDGNRGIGSIALDTSSQRDAKKAEAELAAIVMSSGDAIIGHDLNGMITSWNNSAATIFGYSAEEAIGKHLSMLSPSELHSEIDRIQVGIKNGERVQHIETERVTMSGKRLSISLTVSPIIGLDGTVIGASSIVRDITEAKQSSARLEEVNHELKQRVYELAETNAALQTARDQALEASNLKSAFVANISHELRTPLSGILGMSELLLSMERDAQLVSMIQTIHESGEALLGVVNDILDLSRIEAGKIILEHEAFNVSYVVQDCTKLLASAAATKHLALELTLDTHIPQFVFGDAARIRQVLLNLIGNALKFTKEGFVRVSARAEFSNDHTATILFAVEDSGIGISTNEQRYLFLPFSQIDSSTTRKHGGTGLGLAISKRFVDLMGGEIGFSSEKRVGSTFWFRIPFSKRRTANTENQESEYDKVSPDTIPLLSAMNKILIVEDSEVLQQLALHQLNSLGAHCEAVMTGNEAITAAATGKFHIILMDINLPDMTGYDATRTIREAEKASRSPAHAIIAMTAGAMKGDREKAIESGMDDYLAKPVSIDLLKATLEKWFKKEEISFAPPEKASGQEPGGTRQSQDQGAEVETVKGAGKISRSVSQLNSPDQ